MKLVPNPEWEAAHYQLSALDERGLPVPNTSPLRFTSENYMAAIRALRTNDNDTLNKLAIPQYITIT